MNCLCNTLRTLYFYSLKKIITIQKRKNLKCYLLDKKWIGNFMLRLPFLTQETLLVFYLTSNYMGWPDFDLLVHFCLFISSPRRSLGELMLYRRHPGLVKFFRAGPSMVTLVILIFRILMCKGGSTVFSLEWRRNIFQNNLLKRGSSESDLALWPLGFM